jgi:hypothetical protein
MQVAMIWSCQADKFKGKKIKDKKKKQPRLTRVNLLNSWSKLWTSLDLIDFFCFITW